MSSCLYYEKDFYILEELDNGLGVSSILYTLEINRSNFYGDSDQIYLEIRKESKSLLLLHLSKKDAYLLSEKLKCLIEKNNNEIYYEKELYPPRYSDGKSDNTKTAYNLKMELNNNQVYLYLSTNHKHIISFSLNEKEVCDLSEKIKDSVDSIDYDNS